MRFAHLNIQIWYEIILLSVFDDMLTVLVLDNLHILIKMKSYLLEFKIGVWPNLVYISSKYKQSPEFLDIKYVSFFFQWKLLTPSSFRSRGILQNNTNVKENTPLKKIKLGFN